MTEEKKKEPRKFSGDQQEILVNDGLYVEYDLTGIEDDALRKFMWSGSVDLYCPTCESPSVFTIKSEPYKLPHEPQKSIPKFEVLTVVGKCTRTPEKSGGYRSNCLGTLHVCFYRTSDWMIKIGAYPSRAQIDFGGINPAIKELDSLLRDEWGRAIGLRAHGVGVGSFVYLRRIFERLLERAHDKAKAEEKRWNARKFDKKRVPEKIKMLKAYLPKRLVDSAVSYSILSQGLHELSEEECLKYFDIVKQGIEFVLMEEYENKKFSEVAKELNAVASQ